MHIESIHQAIEDHLRAVHDVRTECSSFIGEFVKLAVKTFEEGRKILVMGNGGSAADAQHFAAEFVGRFLMERKGLPAIALTTDTSILTALGNDYGFDDVFRRQVEALSVAGDLVVGISTSGNSLNVLKALKEAKGRGCCTVGLLGRDGGAIKDAVDLALVVPSNHTPRIQEGHSLIIHIVCDLVEKALFVEKGGAGE